MPTNLAKYRRIHALIKHERYKWVVVRYQFMVAYYRLYSLDNLVVDIDDIPYKKLESHLKFEHKELRPEDHIKIRRLKKISEKVSHMARVNFITNREDLNLFENSYFLPNIPLFPQKEIVRPKKNRIIFVGSMSQDMNFLGVDRFIQTEWPEIRKRFPDLEFHVIGRGLPESFKSKWSLSPGVVPRGFVNDIDIEYAEATAAVAPIYTGAGTNIKVLEALAHRCPIVVSDFALRGFEQILKDHTHILIADSREGFAGPISDLMTRPGLRDLLVENGHEAVIREYSFSKFNSLVHQALDKI